MIGRSGRSRRRVVNRLLIAALVAGLGAGLIGAMLVQRAARSTAIEDAHTQNLALADQYAVRLDARVDSLLAQLRLVASRRELTRVTPETLPELNVVLRVSPTFGELVLHDAAGRPVVAAATRFVADPEQYAERPTLIDAVAEGDLVELSDRGEPVLELAVRVEDPPGTVVGALLARAPLELVTVPVETVTAPTDPIPFVVENDGTIVVHRDRSRVVSRERFPLQEVLGSEDQTATIEQDGEDHLMAATRSQRLPATVVVDQLEAVALEPVIQQGRELMLILLASVLATLVAVIAAGELLLRPLGPLTEVVARVGRGERGVRAGPSGYGEIGLLAGEVDRMAEALDRRDEQLGELRDLSLLIGSLAERTDVANRIAKGGAKLVRAHGCAVCPPRGGDPERLEASAGEMPDPGLVAEVGTGALRTNGPFARPTASGSGELLGVPMTGSDDHPLGALLVHRRDRPFDEEDRSIVAAFASFGAVALDNARRLALQHALVEELQDVVDRRRDLIGNITHEFRTPLACIEGFSTALIDGWERYSEEERQELVRRVAHHGEELDDLVSRFLDFTVTERGGLTAQIGRVDLAAAVQQAVDALAPLLSEREVAVDVPAMSVSADSALLRRTLTNLLSNAVKYSSPGSRVAIRAVADAVRVRVDVVDEGAGLTVQEAARAFEPFWRGGDPTTRVKRGAGLGLALVAEYVRAMGGSTGVTSEPGRGSTFFFTLPLATVPAPEGAARGVTA